MSRSINVFLFVFAFSVGFSIFLFVKPTAGPVTAQNLQIRTQKTPKQELNVRNKVIPLVKPFPLAEMPSAIFEYPEREPEEWQGMLASRYSPPCTSKNSCGMALACIAEKCAPCEEDYECGSNEKCVLQHCVLERFVDCRKRRDCNEDEYCILSEYSSDIRGNSDMKSFCLAPTGGMPQVENLEERKVFDKVRGPYQREDVTIERLSSGL